MIDLIEDLTSFLHASPTPWHTVQEMGNRLALKEFTPLNEREFWQLEHGKKYFVIRDGSLCAFTLPTQRPKRYLILASHTDSPGLQIKPQPEIRKKNMVLLNTSIYGGPLLSSWLNRDLAIAGRVVVKNLQGKIEERLVFMDECPLIIAQLAIHLARDVNDKGLLIDKQEQLHPLLTLTEDAEETHLLEKMIRRHLSFHALLSYDLFLVPLEQSRFLCFERELIASSRLDNLACVHAAIAAMAASSCREETIQLCIAWNHEEIGSKSAEAAGSSFFSDLIKRISICLGLKEEEQIQIKRSSLCLSLDMAHGYAPDYSSKFDSEHPCLLGKGITIKYSSELKYSSTAITAALVVDACKALSLPYQNYISRNDIASGSTIGPIFSTLEGIPTVDIGIAQLSMHSIREIMAVSDYLELYQILVYLLSREEL